MASYHEEIKKNNLGSRERCIRSSYLEVDQTLVTELNLSTTVHLQLKTTIKLTAILLSCNVSELI
jgi:hypothetical protein